MATTRADHPEYPSAHAFHSTALTDAVAAFFGTNQLTWTLETDKTAVPTLVQTRRTYQGNAALMTDIDNARVWAGLHYRNSMNEGRALGARVAQHVTTNFFRPRTPASPAQLPRTGNSSLWFVVTVGLSLASTGALSRAVSSRRWPARSGRVGGHPVRQVEATMRENSSGRSTPANGLNPIHLGKLRTKARLPVSVTAPRRSASPMERSPSHSSTMVRRDVVT
jgi:hypothetical protein